ncbi:RimK-like ATP-grasp domain-containing protein [Halobacillus alkaliphilus]|uniref:RimK-like ATP-grasp domain-containing protein n=1 Tax=Halobacillus alkaliphilus TaxID=396056 RepID=A0A1I2Q9F0_9BACI|nr:alpha-L-glutamate ligase [Halobacillus alkaliphilus]SFG24974.1 RimK-like ATP-grasp domain-containing protein [Halobacillus alkaliphilus]
MSKIYVLHENDEWTDHLTERLEELELPFELWHLDQGTLDLTEEPPEGIFYNRISASSHTRNHRYAPEFTGAVLSWLERHGRTVVNGTSALNLEISKVNQYMALNQQGIRTPKTISAVGKENILQAADKLGMNSFITKHNRAGKGQGVQLFHSKEALQEYVEGPGFEEPVDGIKLIQQYIEAPEPYIVRHEFVNGKFLYGVKVDTSEGFELCPADACSIEDQFCPTDAEKSQEKAKFEILDNYRPAIIDDFEAFLQSNNVQVAAIEAIQDQEGNLYAYDVNTNTNYNSDAEEKAGVYGMLELAKYLGSLLDPVRV